MASIILQNACVDFMIYNASSRSIKKMVMGSVGGLLKSSDSGKAMVRALSDINLKLKSGDKLALVGHNGAGKSTMLKLLGGVYEPTSGVCKINGKVSSLLEMTMGMDFELSGRQNIIHRSVLFGKTFKESKALIEDVSEFSQLGSYIDLPLRTYSSGMVLRLAFGLSTAINPEIVLLDEVIGVGDASFAERSKERLNNMLSKANILVLASHNNDILREYCNVGALLKEGRIVHFGPLEEVIQMHLHHQY
jgi:ABC-2 type transport system ATP-binding protein/lipopolysaccharide transport system ATP-binding protein